MSFIKLICRSLYFHRRAHAGVLIGTVLAAAVLTGALLVGDSVDFSLRQFAIRRLGDIHFAVNTRGRFFSDTLAAAVAKRADVPVTPALQLSGMAIRQGTRAGDSVQVNRVRVTGVRPAFWSFADGAATEIRPGEVALNRKLATALGVKQGDTISLRVGKPALMSRDALLSSRATAFSTRARMKIARIVAADHLANFSLAVSQTVPYNAFVNLEWAQKQVGLGQRVNLMLAGSGTDIDRISDALDAAWQPEHVGLRFRRFGPDLVQLESDSVFIDSETARAALNIPGATGTLAYMVNSISSDSGSTPYSFVVAGPVPAGTADTEIIVNRWLADHINVGVGDHVTMKYYQLAPSGKLAEKSRTFTVSGIREMADIEQERDLMPVFPGLSDVESCSDWDVGMPMDKSMLADKPNEEYWQQFRQTPKAFVTLRAGRSMWGNRFGDLTGVRYSATPSEEPGIRDALIKSIDHRKTGLVFQPVHAQALASVSQAMDFGQLFLGMSFFLIVAALMLTGLLCVFGVQQRSGEMGTLAAVGFSRWRVRSIFFLEFGTVTLAGSALGAVLGTVYTRTLIAGLSRYWRDAVAGSAISYHAESNTVMTGMTASLVCALVAICIAMWRQTRQTPVQLLTGDTGTDLVSARTVRRHTISLAVSIICGLAAVAAIVYVLVDKPDDIVTPFFGAGSALLVSSLGICRYVLMRIATGSAGRDLSITGIAVRNLARRTGRSLTTVALLASGCFMVFAVSSMREDITAHADKPWSGTGGFGLFAESTLPIIDGIDKTDGNSHLDVVNIKVRDGDDASCLNLSRAANPRLLGVDPNKMAARKSFLAKGGTDNIWKLLDRDMPDGTVPALVGDTDTALWGLEKKTGVETGSVLVYRDEIGRKVSVRLVGSLPMRLSVFQGTILISDKSFTRMYPSEDGYRMFLIDPGNTDPGHVVSGLSRQFARFGLDVVPAVDRLRDFYSVEQTYMAMFLVLGGLGLVLGSAGMGIVVLRNLIERRGELAMLQALGYSCRAVNKMLITEHGLLFAAGLGAGIFSAAVAMVPAVLSSESEISWPTQIILAVLVVAVCTAAVKTAVRIGFRENDLSALRNE